MMFTFVPLYVTAVFLERMVIPRSRSRSLESMTRVSIFSLSLNTFDCASIESTSVVFPWSTCAMMATLRTSLRALRLASAAATAGGSAMASARVSVVVRLAAVALLAAFWGALEATLKRAAAGAACAARACCMLPAV